MDSKITRTVNGHHADPKSTRDLHHVTDEELDHIRMSCEAGMLEAEVYLAMGDAELAATFEGNLRAIKEAGLGHPGAIPEINSTLREYLQERLDACNSLLRKLHASRGGAIRGITPVEYEHLVTSLQAGYREAEVCCPLTHRQIRDAFQAVRVMRERLGLGFENPYAAFGGDYLEFFLERSEVLWDLLGRVNFHYSGESSKVGFAKFA